jgi:competence ComEA-like helix-hairpin-helix protein
MKKFLILHSSFLIPMSFSRQQQLVLAFCFFLYGLWGMVAPEFQPNIRSAPQPLRYPESPELAFYLDPPINLNTSTSVELQLLPSIGPVIAHRIITYRESYGPFTRLDDLTQIKGISQKTLRKLHWYVAIK